MTKQIGDSTLIDTWAATGTITAPDASKKNQGWTLGERPPFEYMNWLQNTFGQKINHMLSRGAVDWNATTPFMVGALVNHTGSLWVAVTDNTDSVPSGANANWDEVVTDIPTTITAPITLSGLQINTPNIPSWVTKIDIIVNKVTFAGSETMAIGLLTGVEGNNFFGYESIFVNPAVTSASISDGQFGWGVGNVSTASEELSGSISIQRREISADEWVFSSSIVSTSASNHAFFASGSKSLPSALTGVSFNVGSVINRDAYTGGTALIRLS